MLRNQKLVYTLSLAVFLGYGAWMLGPYLHSTIVRDAAVTTWIHAATSPIEGVVEATPVAVGEQVGADGVILTVRNARTTRAAVHEAKIRAELARTRVAELEDFIAEVRLLDAGRGELKARYADTFRAQLEAEIEGLEEKLGVVAERLATMRQVAARSANLATRGVGAETTADEARMRVAELEEELAELRMARAYANVRREAAGESVFITADGEDPAWVLDQRLDLKLAKAEARLELHEARAELELAEAALVAADEDFRAQSEAVVRAPPGHVLWSRRVVSGAAVIAGEEVATSLDCRVLMIDVPVADAEVALIRPGMVAEVVLEGERRARRGAVVLTRGAASTLGHDDLAAIAKGRTEGVAQVVLDLEAEPTEFERCPVGHAAYVDFPDVGLIDVLRARIRL